MASFFVQRKGWRDKSAKHQTNRLKREGKVLRICSGAAIISWISRNPGHFDMRPKPTSVSGDLNMRIKRFCKSSAVTASTEEKQNENDDCSRQTAWWKREEPTHWFFPPKRPVVSIRWRQESAERYPQRQRDSSPNSSAASIPADSWHVEALRLGLAPLQ